MPKKPTTTKKPTSKTAPTAPAVKERYLEAMGARKTAHARVRLYVKKGSVLVNDKDYKLYFPTSKHQNIVQAPLKIANLLGAVSATVRVAGGGINAQAEAVRHGLARTLVMMNEEFKSRLRHAGYLTRDPRMVERKKYGLKKARRAPQWAKR